MSRRRKRYRGWVLWALLTLGAGKGGAEILGGRVVSAGARPVEHARIESSGGGVTVFSDREGRFEIDTELPTVLEITHPRFEPQRLPVRETHRELEVVLVLKQAVFESIAVSANRGSENFAPISVATSVIEPLETTAPASSLTQLLAETAGVAENGQGGMFQTYSIRGVARQRVATLLAGMRIVGERRAGVSASFVDPLLIGRVDVVRGPSSTYYGSGALGGIVQLFPRRFDRMTVAGGFESQGREHHLLVAGGDGAASWGVALRDAGTAETPTGGELNSGFRQLSASLARRWEINGLRVDASTVASSGRDIGKSSTDFPERTTVYPEEEHLIARLAVERPALWKVELALHPNRLETAVETPRRERSELENRAFDVGLGFERRFPGVRRGALRVGADYFGRRGVTLRESTYDLSAFGRERQAVDETLDDGREDELGLFGAWEWNLGSSALVAGGRLTWLRQSNRGTQSIEDGAATAFMGIVVPAGRGFELVANLGSGLRYPSLSERFFTGTTGRGSVIGGADLEPERSLNLDAGVRFYGQRLFFTGSLFDNRIDDYIERVELEPDRLTFTNLGEGRIRGVEIEVLVELAAGWSLELGGHAIEGRDDSDKPLADIPPNRLYASTRLDRGRWDWRLRYEARARKDDPGSGEKATPAAGLVSSALDYRLEPGLSLRLALRNALDESYFNSADRKVPEAPGRSLSLSVRWERGR